MLHKLFQKIGVDTSQSILWDQYYPATKLDKDSARKGTKDLTKLPANQIEQHVKNTIHHDQVKFIPWT